MSGVNSSGEKKHFPFIDIVRRLARSNWGKAFSSPEEAEKYLIDRDLSVIMAATLDMIRKIDRVIGALVADREDEKREKREAQRQLDDKRPEEAKVFAESNIGDLLYCCWEIETGIERYVIVAKDADNYVRIVCSADDCDYSDEYDSRVKWATELFFTSEAAALKYRAERYVEYHKPVLELAKKALSAVKHGDDLYQFREGIEAE